MGETSPIQPPGLVNSLQSRHTWSVYWDEQPGRQGCCPWTAQDLWLRHQLRASPSSPTNAATFRSLPRKPSWHLTASHSLRPFYAIKRRGWNDGYVGNVPDSQSWVKSVESYKSSIHSTGTYNPRVPMRRWEAETGAPQELPGWLVLHELQQRRPCTGTHICKYLK